MPEFSAPGGVEQVPASGDALAARVATLMIDSQSGSPQTVLRDAPALEFELLVADHRELLHRARYARLVALHMLGRHVECRSAVGDLLAQPELPSLWECSYLSLRAEQNDALGSPDEALRDLVLAQVLLESAGKGDPLPLSYALTGLAVGFDALGLYELALPHYERARDVGASVTGQPEARAVYSLNLAEMHLRWSLELAAIGARLEARKHRGLARDLAREGRQHCRGLPRSWLVNAELQLWCVEAIDGDSYRAVIELTSYSREAESLGLSLERAFAQPFLSRAHELSGDLDAAVEVAREATRHLPDNAGQHLRRAALAQWADAELALARGSARAPGSAHPEDRHDQAETAALAALSYAQVLSQALWQQRLDRLRATQTMLDLEHLRVEHAESTRASVEDPLTQAANLRGLRVALQRATRGERRRETSPENLPSRPESISVLLVDIDNFKAVNDTSGHEAGDRVLCEVADLMRACGRDGDVVARPGGDEFVMVLAGANATVAEAVAARVLDAARRHDWGAVPITWSIGLATASTPADPDDLLRRADEAMYRAKRAGGHQLEISA